MKIINVFFLILLLSLGDSLLANIFPLKLETTIGENSKDQDLSVLKELNHSLSMDDWSCYIDFQPSKKGLESVFLFILPKNLDENTNGFKLDVNYKGWERNKQKWVFEIYNVLEKKWEMLGTNEDALSWEWSLLIFDIQKNLFEYSDFNREVKIRYSTLSSKENSMLDYVSIRESEYKNAGVISGFEKNKNVLPNYLWGLTITDVDNLPKIVSSISNLPKKTLSRVVFDEYIDARTYFSSLKALHKYSYIMGEILDSEYIKEYSYKSFKKRVDQYLAKLHSYVDIWEIMNEANGEWLGKTKDVIKKMTYAYNESKKQNYKTALTLYYNEGCFEKTDHEALFWAKKNIPDSIKKGIDYVFLSYYEDDCAGLQPDWEQVFLDLGTIFPKAKLGIGECGTEKKYLKKSYLDRYYALEIKHPRFVGGFFWWYFIEDMVPYQKPLWRDLSDLMLKDPN